MRGPTNAEGQGARPTLRSVRRQRTVAGLGSNDLVAAPAPRKPVKSIGRHQARCYDPVTGRKITR